VLRRGKRKGGCEREIREDIGKKERDMERGMVRMGKEKGRKCERAQGRGIARQD